MAEIFNEAKSLVKQIAKIYSSKWAGSLKGTVEEAIAGKIRPLVKERKRRIHWQDLCYHAMTTLDACLGRNISKGEGTTEATFKADCDALKEELLEAEAKVRGRDETIERLMNEWPAEHKFPKGLMEKDRPEATT